jgi:hypothetical protein
MFANVVRDEPKGMSGEPRRIVPTVIALASIAGMVAGMLRGPLVAAGDGLWPLTWVSWPVVGWVINIRKPGNRIGTVCLTIGAVQGLGLAIQSMVFDVSSTAAAWMELAYTVLGVVPWLAILWLLVTFPTGGYAGRLERFLGRAVIALAVWAMVGFAISPATLTDTGMENPLAQPSLSALAVIANDSGFLLVIALGLAAIIGLFLRSARSIGIERQQFRWLMLGGLVFVLIAGAGQFLPEDSASELIWLLGGSAIPISIGVAVARYRLYEIDRIISRTVGYVLVIGLLAVVLLGALSLLTLVLPAESPLAVAGSTLAAAALFNPVRKRVHDAVDRRFNRSRYDAQRVLEELSASMRGQIDPETVRREWVGAVVGTMQPASVAVWVRERS